MRCDEFAERLDDVLDERCDPTADPGLCKHAQACPSCRQELAAVGRLLTGLEVWDAPTPSPDFAQRVVAQVMANKRSRSWYRAAWYGWMVAAAALLLMAVLPAYWLTSQTDNRSAAVMSPDADARVALARPNAPAPPLLDPLPNNSLWTHYGTSIWQLYPESARERHRQQISEIADDLRPIATSFNAAVSAIRRTIPVGRPPDRSPSRTSHSIARLPDAIS